MKKELKTAFLRYMQKVGMMNKIRLDAEGQEDEMEPSYKIWSKSFDEIDYLSHGLDK